MIMRCHEAVICGTTHESERGHLSFQETDSLICIGKIQIRTESRVVVTEATP